MKSWVSSAFAEISTNKSVPNRKTSSLEAPSTSTTTKSRRTATTADRAPSVTGKLISSTIDSVKSKYDTNKQTKRSQQSDLSLAEKYEPANRSELVINKSKVDQLSNAIDDITSRKKASILIVDGPSGCGKTTTLKVLCKEKNVQIENWSSEILNIKSIDTGNELHDHHTNDTADTQIKLFKQFLFKSSRYMPNQIFADACAPEQHRSQLSQQQQQHSNGKNMSKLLVVKEIPFMFYKEPYRFNQLLKDYITYAKYSIVFVITQCNSSGGSSRSNDVNTNPNRLFTSELKKDLAIVEVNFNSVANSYLIKQLDKISKAENFKFVNKQLLEVLCETACGDLRNAINILQIESVNPSGMKMPLTSAHKTNVKSASGQKTSLELNSKNINYSIFRGIGKILHRKNLDPSESTYASKLQAEKTLPDHLRAQNKHRLPLSYDPDDLYGKIPLGADTIIMYLFQNYLEIYKLKSQNRNFYDTFDGLESISEHFMLADQMSRRSYQYESNESSEGRLKELATLTMIRCMLYNMSNGGDLQQQSQAGDLSTAAKSIWMPLYKPFTSKINEAKLKREKLANEILQLNLNNEHNHVIKYLIDIKREFFTVYLPYALLRVRCGNNRTPGSNNIMMLNHLGKGDFLYLTNKMKPINSKLSSTQMNGENDYSNDNDDDSNNNYMAKLADHQFPQPTAVKGSCSTYVYEEDADLDIINEKF